MPVGGRVNYTHWGPDKVDHQGQDCVVLIPDMGGIWDDVSCAHTVHHYPFCEIRTWLSFIVCFCITVLLNNTCVYK